MQRRFFHTVLSAFMAFVLVFTCNSATVQPLAAFAEEAASQMTPVGAEEASSPEGAPDPEGAAEEPEEAEGDMAAIVPDGVENDGYASGSEVRASRDLTNDEGVLFIALTGFAYADSEGLVQVVETSDSGLDVSDLDMNAVSDLELRYKVRLQPGDVAEGDTLDLPVPRDAFSVDEDRLIDANANVVEHLSFEARKDALKIAVAQSAVPSDEPVEFEVCVPVVLIDNAQAADAREVELTLQGERVATVVLLAAKAKSGAGSKEEAAEQNAADEEQIETDRAISSQRSMPSRANDNPDKTHDLDQLLLGVAAFSYKDAQGASHDIPNTGTETAPKYDFSNIPFATIGDMYMEVDFRIVPDDETRKIKEGDYYRYALPSIFKVDPDAAPKDLYSPLGQKIAAYTIEEDADGKAYFKVVFTDTVNIEKGYVSILGGVGATFKLDKDNLKNDDSTKELWTLQNGGTTYEFIAPSTSSELKGVEKHGTYNKDDNTVSWTITVGSDPSSAGLSLKGITVTDTFDKAKQTMQDVKGPDGTLLSVTDADSGFSYTFPDDSAAVAPYRITVTTKVDKRVLDATVNGGQPVENGVKIESPKDSEVVVPPEQEATDNVTVPAFGFSKEGEPLNSSTIAWYLTVNEGGVGAATNVVVYDRLDARATYIDETLKIGGAPVTVYKNRPDTVPGGTYAVLLENQTDGEGAYSLMEIHFAGMVNTEQNIAFETSVAIEDNEANYQPIDFNNRAWIDYDWPSGEGPGEGAIPGLDINADFQVVYLDKETPSYDEHTGVIDWTIAPSTRTENYTQGVITDVVGATDVEGEFDQDLVVDASNPTGYAIEVAHKDGTRFADDELKAVFGYDSTTHLMTFTFDKAVHSLNDLVITYKSQALNFLRENWTDHVYRNAAHLSVSGDGTTFEADDGVERTFKNEFLAKASDYSVVDSAGESTGYLHYRITVNGSQMPNTTLSLTDDLSALETSVVDSNGVEKTTVEASKWTFVNGNPADKSVKVTKKQGAVESDVTSTFSVSDWVSAKKIDFNVTGDDAASACYVIDLYLTLDKSELQRLYKDDQLVDGFRVLVKNTAKADSDGYQGKGGAQVECVGSQDSPDISEQFAEKTVDGSHHKDGYLDYRIELNPNGLALAHAVATDEFDESLEIDLDSVHLYYAEHEGASIKDGHGGAVAATTWTKQLAYDAEHDKIVLKVALPDGAASYVLEYRAKIIGSAPGGKVSNTVSVVMGDVPLGDDSVTADVDVDSWGWLTQMAIYKLVKVDAFSGETSPLSGVRFLLSKENDPDTIIKTALSNKDGLVSFYGLEPLTTYHYKEDESSVNAAQYTTTEGTFKTDIAGTTIIQGQDKAVKNDRTTANVDVELTKEYASKDGYTGTLQSTFRLYLYPNGRGTNPKVPIAVTANAAGDYAYDADGAAYELHDASTGALSIGGLPWGDYGIEETGTADGYTLYQGARYFSVVAPETQGGTWTVDYEPARSAQDATRKISNVPTKLTVKKSTTGASLQDAVLSIYRSNADGSQGDDKVVSPFGGTELTTTIADDVKSFTWSLDGIPAGTYWLVEDAGPKDATLSKFDPVQFSVDEYGNVTKNSGSGTLSGTVLSVRDDVAQVKVQKLDQWGTSVKNAKLTLEKKSGDAWDSKERQVTDGSTVVFAGLDRGATYRIVETKTPEGYVQANHGSGGQTIEFTINEFGKAIDVKLCNDGAPSGDSGNFQNINQGGNAFIMRNERIVGHAQFTKYDASAAGKVLKGIQFDLYKMEGASPDLNADTLVNASHFSGTSGTISTKGATITNNLTGEQLGRGLTPGTYYFVEVGTGSHDDFAFDADDPLVTEPFTIDKDTNRYTWSVDGSKVSYGTPITLDKTKDGGAIVNMPLNAQVKLAKKKVDGSEALIGATFELRDASGKAVDRQTTSRAGTTFTNTVKPTDSNGNTPTATSAQDGELSFVNIPAGTYTVVETVPAPGYKLNGETYAVEVVQSKADLVYVIKDDGVEYVANEKTSFSLEKVDADNAELVNDVELSAYAKGATDAGNELLTWARSAAGDVALSRGPKAPATLDFAGDAILGLPAGDYVLKETKTPDAYVTAADIAFTVNKDGSLSSKTDNAVNGLELIMRDRLAKASVELTKSIKDGEAGTIEGVEFSLYEKGGTLVQNGLTTDERGKLTVGGLGVGEYYFVETKATPDTVLDTTMHEFSVTSADDGKTVPVSAVNEPFAASLELTKLDATSGDALAGAAFALTYTPEGGGASQVIAVPATGDAGAYRVGDLKKGTYVLEETAVPNGYEQPFKATFSLTDADNGATVTVRDDAAGAVAVTKTAGTWDAFGVTNARTLGSLALTKVGEQDEPLGGVLFLLERCESGTWSTVGMYATNANGTLVVSDLAWGAYRISEAKAAPGYEPGGNAVPIAFEVGPNSGTDVKLTWDHGTIANERTSIAIEKVDDAATPQRLEGAHLRLTGAFADGTTEKEWTSSRDAAEVLTGQLVVGQRYVLEETERLPGYLALPGAIAFALNDAGQIVLESAPVYGDGSLAARLSADGAQLSVRNVKVRGVVTLSKTDADAGVPLDGAVFALYDGAGNLVRDGLETGRAYAAADWSATDAAAGVLSIEGLDLGSYSLRETAAEGYQVPDTAYPFTIDNDNATKVPSCDLGTIANRQTELSFVKTGLCVEQCSDPVLGAEAPDAAVPLAGAVFTAYDDAACAHAVATAISDEAGLVTFKKLPAATYWVRETTTPAGHVPSDAVYVASFEADGTLSGFVRQGAPDATVDAVVNDVFRADISMRKVSENDASKVLPNSVYGLYKRVSSPLSRGAEPLQLIAKATTDEHGLLTFKGVLMDQEYVVQELEAPDGSLVSKHPIVLTFTVGDEGAPRLATFDDGSGTAEVDENGVIVWKEPQVTVAFNKKTPEGDALAGALLEVVDEKGAVVVEPWTSQEGKGVQVEGVLVAGATYRLVELEAPDGYLRADDVSFTVENPKLGPQEGFVQQVDMVDERETTPPAKTPASTKPFGFLAKTGDRPFALVVGGVVLAAAGIAAVAGVRRRRTRA